MEGYAAVELETEKRPNPDYDTDSLQLRVWDTETTSKKNPDSLIILTAFIFCSREDGLMKVDMPITGRGRDKGSPS
jgi:hypothetical protein